MVDGSGRRVATAAVKNQIVDGVMICSICSERVRCHDRTKSKSQPACRSSMVATNVANVETCHHNPGGGIWVVAPVKDQRRRARRITIKHEISVGVRGCEWRETICPARSTVALVQQFCSANSQACPIASTFGGKLRPFARVQRQSSFVSANLIFLINQNNARRRDPPR